MTDEKKVTFEDIRDKVKDEATRVWNIASQKAEDGLNWVINNPEMVLAGLGACAALLKASQSLVVSHRNAVERHRIDTTWYDPSTGFHWELKKKVSNAQRAEILRRKSEGQDVYTILSQMRLLK